MSEDVKHCLPERVWDELATGLLRGAEADAAVEHASWCADCAGRLRESLRIFRPESAIVPLRAVPRRSRAWWWAGLAASLLIGTLGVWRWRQATDPLVLLAQAYGQQRTIELRLLGAPYARFDRTRSGAGDLVARSSAMLEAATRIRAGLDRNPEDGGLLHARGRLALMEGKADEALSALLASRDQGPPSVALQLDLAAAYYQRGLRRGSVGTSDLMLAQETLSRVLAANPDLPEALFNRAIVSSELYQLAPAVQDLERLLRVEKDPAWRSEAETQLASVRNRLIGFLQRRPGDDEERFAEVALDLRLKEGLWLGPNAAQLPSLSRRLATEHGDLWLRTMLALPRKERFKDAVRLLAWFAETRLTAQRGRYQQEKDAAARFERMPLPPPLAAWRDFEFGYRSTHSGGDFPCAVPDTVLPAYRWFDVQNERERAACATQHQAVDKAAAGMARAQSKAERAGFAVSAARAEAAVASLEYRKGFYREASGRQRDLAGRIIAQRLPASRLHEPMLLMMAAAEALGRFHAARLAAEMAAVAARAGGLRNAEFNDLAAAAGFAQRCGDFAEAQRLYQAAARFYDESQGQASLRSGRVLMELIRMEDSSDSRRLAPFAEFLKSTKDPLVRTPYRRLLARQRTGQGDLAGAEQILAESFRELLQSKPSGQRIAWYRELERVSNQRLSLLISRNEAAKAWTILQEIREGEAGLASPRSPGLGAHVDFTLRRLPNGLYVWRRDGASVAVRGSSADPDSLERLIRLLLRQASDSRSDAAAAFATSRKLTNALFGTWLDDLPSGKTVLFQAEGIFSAIPFPLLMTKDGPIGSRHPIALAYGAIRDTTPQPAAVEPDRTAVLVDATRVPGLERWNALPLPPPLEESAALREYIPSARVLDGRELSTNDFSQWFRRANLIHFAGHAFPQGLLLRDGLFQPSSLAAGGRAPRRVVLSACSTGRRHQEEEDTLGAETLAQAFIAAGATEVVASSWDLDDRAAGFLMQRMYGALRESDDLGEALRRAARSMSEKAEFSHPYYWAGVMRVVAI